MSIYQLQTWFACLKTRAQQPSLLMARKNENSLQDEGLVKLHYYITKRALRQSLRSLTVAFGGLTERSTVNRSLSKFWLSTISNLNSCRRRTFLVKVFQLLLSNFWKAALTPEQKQEVINFAEIKTYQKGMEIFKQNTQSQDFYILIEGVVVLMSGSYEIKKLLKGDWFGEEALYPRTMRNHTARAFGGPVSWIHIWLCQIFKYLV